MKGSGEFLEERYYFCLGEWREDREHCVMNDGHLDRSLKNESVTSNSKEKRRSRQERKARTKSGSVKLQKRPGKAERSGLRASLQWYFGV